MIALGLNAIHSDQTCVGTCFVRTPGETGAGPHTRVYSTTEAGYMVLLEQSWSDSSASL